MISSYKNDQKYKNIKILYHYIHLSLSYTTIFKKFNEKKLREGRMFLIRSLAGLILFIFVAIFTIAATNNNNKVKMINSIDQKADHHWQIAYQIWQWAEPGYQEKKSSALLAENLEKAGFTIERGIAEIPTALMATYGSGQPILGIIGEFDALPGFARDGQARPGENVSHPPHAQRGESYDGQSEEFRINQHSLPADGLYHR